MISFTRAVLQDERFPMRKGKPLYIPLTYLALYSNSPVPNQ